MKKTKHIKAEDLLENQSVFDFPDRFKIVAIDFPNLKPSTQNLTLRVPSGLINDIKKVANQKDVPYQSLMKVWLSERLQQEWGVLHDSAAKYSPLGDPTKD